MPTETTTETKPAAGMRDALLDIAAAANDALYTSHPTAEAAETAYADALDLIRKRLGADGAYFTPTALLAGGAAPKRDWLDMPGDFRLSRFHISRRTTFVGVRHNHGDNGGNIYTVEVFRDKSDDSSVFKLTRNGNRLAIGSIDFGREMGVERAAVGMLHGILAQLERDRRHNKRNKQNRKARKAAAKAAAPIDPPMDIPPRPGLPEDDE